MRRQFGHLVFAAAAMIAVSESAGAATSSPLTQANNSGPGPSFRVSNGDAAQFVGGRGQANLYLVDDVQAGTGATRIQSPGFALTSQPVGVASPATAVMAPISQVPMPGDGGISVPVSTLSEGDDTPKPVIAHKPKHVIPTSMSKPGTGACPPAAKPHPAVHVATKPAMKKPHYAYHPMALAPAPAVAMALHPDQNTWSVRPGETLQSALEEWAGQVNWTVLYNSEYQYPIQTAATFHGNFVTAGQELIQAVSASPVPVGQFDQGNSTVIITSRDH